MSGKKRTLPDFVVQIGPENGPETYRSNESTLDARRTTTGQSHRPPCCAARKASATDLEPIQPTAQPARCCVTWER